MANSNQNQEIISHGGARKGAGRPKGSTDKLRIADCFSIEEREQLVAQAKLLAFGDENTKPNERVLLALIEQVYGKATQKIAGDDDGDPLRFIEILRNGKIND